MGFVMSLVVAVQSPAWAEAGFSGMQVQGITRAISKALGLDAPIGILVRDVALGGPADLSGISRGDLIVKIDGRKIGNFKQVVKIMSRTKPGQTLKIILIRAGKTMTLDLLLSKRPEEWKVTRDEVASLPTIGITMAAITPKISKRFGVRWGSNGVFISLVEPNPEQEVGFVRGDIIVQVDQQRVWKPSQVVALYNKAKLAKREQMLLLVERTSGFTFMILRVK